MTSKSKTVRFQPPSKTAVNQVASRAVKEPVQKPVKPVRPKTSETNLHKKKKDTIAKAKAKNTIRKGINHKFGKFCGFIN